MRRNAALASLSRDHHQALVGREERELFPLIEQAMPAAELEALADALARAEPAA